MKKLTDEEMQRIIESGSQHGDATNSDFNTYRLLFNELKKDTQEGLPYNFAANVAAKVQLEKDTKLSFVYYMAAFLVALLVFAICLTVASSFTFVMSDGFVPMLQKHKWILLFALAAFILIKYFDQRIIIHAGLYEKR